MVQRSVPGFLSLFLIPIFAAAQAAPITTERCPTEPWNDEVVAKAIGVTSERLANLKAVRALTNNDVCTMPEARLKRALLRVEKPRASAPAEWAQFRAMQQADENGRVQPDGLLRALDKRRQILGLSRGGQPGKPSPFTTGPSSTSPPPAAGIGSGSWTGIGPGNIGGRIRGLVIHPTQTNTMWIGSVSGGMWKSTDAGASWAPVNDFMGNLSISSIVISPTDANVMFASTGEGYFNTDAVRGAGIFKSVDGGVTWTALASTNPLTNSSWYFVNRLAIHPTNGSILLAATNNGLFRSIDGGTSWSLRTGNQRFGDVDFDPLDGNKALVAPGTFGGAVPPSYSLDAGASWTPSNFSIGGGWGRIETAYSRTAGVVYASVDNNPNGTYNPSGSIYRSIDGGINWTLQGTAPNHLSVQGWYNNAIWVDPTNNAHVIVAGLDIYRTTNAGSGAGTIWTKISEWFTAGSVHADHHIIVSSPGYNGTSNRTVFFGNDGGMFKAVDINAVTSTNVGWTNLNNGLAITQFYGGAGHGGTNGRIVGGTQDNGSLIYSGAGTSWNTSFGGDGGFSAIDPTDGNYTYGEYVRLQIHRTTNGANAAYIWNGITDAGSFANFIAPFALDPNNPNTMIAGGRSVWRSTNVKAGAPSWSAILAPTAGNSNTARIAIAQGNSNLIWVGKNNGNLFKTVDGTVAVPTWNQMGLLSSPSVPPSRMVLSLLVDKDTHNTVYAGFGGYSSDNLWRSTDGGVNWTSIGTGLPPSPVRAIERHPTLPNFLYVGTEVGVFTSEDGGTSWNTSNDGPANVSVDQLFWYDPTTLVAVTHGRGMFRTTVTAATNYGLTVSKSGTGSGPVVSSPAGITCGSTCSANFASGTTVTLTATANAGSVFGGWSGACSGTSTCVVNMNAAKSVTATFNPAGLALTVAKAGAGSGPVTSSPSGIACGSTCTSSYAAGTTVTLTATPNSGSVFGGWSGACSGTSTCVVSMTVARNVTATFNPASTGFALTVSKSGTGSGPVSSSPSGVACGSVCVANFAAGTTVTLTATPNSGSTFGGWTGACGGTGTCVVSMNAAKSVTATFNGPPVVNYALNIGKAGSGSGPVSSSPAGISCGSTCNANFASGTSVTLTAAPNGGSVFAGWSGACSGTALTCVVPMSAARNVTATFNLGYVLTVGKAGTGSGPVSSSPAGISCGSVCSAPFAPGASVTLTASPNAGSIFSGWSGECSGTSSCLVTMSAAKAVTATFTAASALGNALDNNSLTWATSGNALWTAQTITTHDGVDAAQSGTGMADFQSSTLSTTVMGPGSLSFWWKVSSEVNFDFLYYTLDGAVQLGISGEAGWVQQTVAIPAGSHAITFRYEKDVSLTVGSDRGWVDEVVFTPGPMMGAFPTGFQRPAAAPKVK